MYDRSEAIRQVQTFLRVAGDPDIFVAPTGVYDDNTRLSIVEFQTRFSLEPTGVVDYKTFTLLYDEYIFLMNKNVVNDMTDSFIRFPILPGESQAAMTHINRSLARLLDYYGHTHRLQNSSFYSKETSKAINILREIYMLDKNDYIDEEFYYRMIKDHDSIKIIYDNFH